MRGHDLCEYPNVAARFYGSSAWGCLASKIEEFILKQLLGMQTDAKMHYFTLNQKRDVLFDKVCVDLQQMPAR